MGEFDLLVVDWSKDLAILHAAALVVAGCFGFVLVYREAERVTRAGRQALGHFWHGERGKCLGMIWLSIWRTFFALTLSSCVVMLLAGVGGTASFNLDIATIWSTGAVLTALLLTHRYLR
ncbi:MAG: hypothetical protein G8D90_21000 [gamma proteobacterium symbiont of Clathrolucina costata]